MDLQVRSSTYGNTEVHLDGSGIEHSKAGTDHSSQSTSYWQLYKEKYHRLGITEKQTASGTSKMIQGTPGGIPLETGLDNSVGSSCRTGKSRQQGSGAAGLGSRCHRTYSERCTRVSTAQQLMRPNSHPSNNIIDSADVKLDMLSSVTPLTSHTLTAADFRNRRNSQEITGSVLGGDDGEKTPMTATPRTSSLLNDPTLRKHLARAMGVDPSSDALEGEINRRVGSVHVPATFIKRTSSCRSATRGTNNNKDDYAGKPDLESLIKMHGKSQEDVTETKGKTEQCVTIGLEKTARSDSGYGAEMPDMTRCLSEGSRILLSGKRTKRTGTSQVERLRVKDVVHQSPEVTSCSTVGASEKHTSPSMEEVKMNTSHLWNSTAKDTELYIVEDVKVLDTQLNRTESTDQKRSTSALPVSPAIARRPALPRRTYSMNVRPTPTDHEVRAGFHMPSFQEYKELKKQNSTTSDNLFTEEEEEEETLSTGVSRTVPKSTSTECKTDCSDTALKVVQESVKQAVMSPEVKQTAAPVEATQKTEVVRKPRRKKTPAKTPDEPTNPQNNKQLILCKQKTTVVCDKEPTTHNPEGKSDTKFVCVVSPVSVPNKHVDIVKPEKALKKQQTIGDLGSIESDLPIAPPRRSRKLKVQLKLPSEVIPDGVGEADPECVDCIAARKTTKSNRRDETFRSSRCRLHRSKLSRQEVIIESCSIFASKQ